MGWIEDSRIYLLHGERTGGYRTPGYILYKEIGRVGLLGVGQIGLLLEEGLETLSRTGWIP